MPGMRSARQDGGVSRCVDGPEIREGKNSRENVLQELADLIIEPEEALFRTISASRLFNTSAPAFA